MGAGATAAPWADLEVDALTIAIGASIAAAALEVDTVTTGALSAGTKAIELFPRRTNRALPEGATTGAALAAAWCTIFSLGT